ncbi:MULTISPECIES: DUF2812 domain-containing protein [unclassified Psychrobacillus]|uniref:DUF2812 domain-containing protein n=1 Tax=unclassified Psychrobacillus TaxID=2636677 RepID=UPI002499A4C4|nr:DUF2812 domain-containing protein [Psychrobacillus sp. NEAU-3TGS]MDI2585783.1 DUF2812 domain-containing protein [Psychrobacillus sp. NEAU-3TGS]
MKKVKYRLYVDYEKEEQWINELAQQGWLLEKFKFFRFTFVKGEAGSYIYRNELLAGLALKDKNEYLQFLKESGIEIVSKFGGWVYFRKKASDGPFGIYTDTASKVSYFNRIIGLFTLLLVFNIIIGIVNLIISGYADSPVNSYTSFFNFAAAILIAVPTIKVYRRKKALQEQQNLFEQ